MSRVVVVGAGLGGLAVAARLARQRHDVVVVEAGETVGGQIGELTSGGFTWDTGPTFLTLPATVRDLFLKTGQPLESALDLEPLDPLTRLSFTDGLSIELPNAGAVEIAAAFEAALGPPAGEQWRRMHERSAQRWTRLRGSLVEGPLPAGRDLAFDPRLARALSPRRTLRQDARRFLDDARQRRWLEHSALAACSDPRRAPAWWSVWPYVEQTFRAWTVGGGMRRLVDAVHDRAVSRGAVVQTRTRAVAVQTAGGRVDGVRLADGQVLPADVVVSDVDAHQLSVEPLAALNARPAEVAASPTVGIFTLLLGLRGSTPDLGRRTVLFGADADVELDAVFGESAHAPEDPTISVFVSPGPGRAPADAEAWTVQVSVPGHGAGPGTVDWTAPDVAAGYAAHLLDRLAARGLDVRDRVVVTTQRSPADVAKATDAPGGAAYGRPGVGHGAGWRRAPNRASAPGLFHVGASAHPGGGIPCVTMSAAIVAEMIGRA